jgi:ribonuclease HI
MIQPILLYSDGSSKGNPGPGGYGVILRCGNKYKELSSGYLNTTNNRMELMGVIVGLEAIKRKNAQVTVYSDSSYVVKAVNEGWVFNWERNNYKNKANSDLWQRFLIIYRKHRVQLVWIKGHAGHAENERCDTLAVEAADKVIREGGIADREATDQSLPLL